MQKIFKIGLMEDDELVAEVIGHAVAQSGWGFRCFGTVAEMRDALLTQPFDLLLLDWSLPDGEAHQVIRLVRQDLASNIPIVIVTVSDDEQLLVKSMAMGADDYIVKPLRVSEIQARMKALLRRSYPEQLSDPIALGPYRIDNLRREVLLDGVPVALTQLEFDLIRYFFAHYDQLLSRNVLLSSVWKRGPGQDTRTVDALVGRLRRKLRLGAKTGLRISTLRGYGYRLESID